MSGSGEWFIEEIEGRLLHYTHCCEGRLNYGRWQSATIVLRYGARYSCHIWIEALDDDRSTAYIHFTRGNVDKLDTWVESDEGHVLRSIFLQCRYINGILLICHPRKGARVKLLCQKSTGTLNDWRILKS